MSGDQWRINAALITVGCICSGAMAPSAVGDTAKVEASVAEDGSVGRAARRDAKRTISAHRSHLTTFR